ncbi:MAG: hypothetical protein D6718_05075 [Acidobacteria bacterium]|nr:MAG: hypothetical protein D6718_05075 [Acidobacteriota bacterium]
MRLDPGLLAPEVGPGIRLLPVLHESVDLAAVVRAVLDTLEPAVVAVELPDTISGAVRRAVRRLPRVSAVVSQEGAEEPLVWFCAPGDPLAEALRWAEERGAAAAFIDPDIPYRTSHADPLPDAHAAFVLGPERFLALVARALARRPAAPEDRARERGMAWRLLRIAASAKGLVLALVGAAHAERIASDLKGPLARPLARTARREVHCLHVHPDSLPGVLREAPLAHAVWERLRGGTVPAAPPVDRVAARPLTLVRGGFRVLAGGRTPGAEDSRRRLLVDAAAAAAARPLGRGFALDRMLLGAFLWKVAARSYERRAGETVRTWQRRLFFDFARRYARVEGLLVPGLYEWTVAARGVADDNLAWELYDAARTYPWQDSEAELPTARVEGGLLDLGTRKVRFRRRFFRVKDRPVRLPVRRRPEADNPARWLEAFDDADICSFPPEDLVIEDYGRFLRRKAVAILSAERARVEPFSTSLLDGIDIRETMRRFHEGKVWVRELLRVPGGAGSVVVIFDRDRDDTRFPLRMTWLGESEQESDMAFYATDPTQHVVGPGIMRATYGGFLMTMPPGRLFDVWIDPDYAAAREKAEVLIMAAVDYSREKLVVHVAERPPAERLRAYAASQGKRIVHIPLASLSPVTLRKIRVVHLLAGRDKRRIARDYIW